MLGVYVASLMVGGVFVLLSAVAGGGEGDLDKDLDLDADADVDLDMDADADLDLDADADADLDLDKDFDKDMDGALQVQGEAGGDAALWMPFFSFKFWTFSSAFFGLTGLLLTMLALLPTQAIIFPIALAVGLTSGTGVSYALHKLKQGEVDTGISARSFVGSEATVKLPFGKGDLGKIVLELESRTLELVAKTDEAEPFERGDRVYIIDLEGDLAQVVRQLS